MSVIERPNAPNQCIIERIGEYDPITPNNNTANTTTTLNNTTTPTTMKIGEESENEMSESEFIEESEDKYFQMVIDNVGAYASFLNTYNKTEQIGSGTESVVYKGTHIDSGKEVAIQETVLVNKQKLISWFAKYLIVKKQKFYTIYEAYLYEQHCENNTGYKVILIQDLLTKNMSQILTEKVLNQNNQNSDSIMNEKEVKHMTFDIVHQLNTLNRHNYVHLDIKPLNIMRNNNGDFTLIDFGFITSCNSLYNGYIGTPEYSAPEMSPFPNSSNNITESTDMWSVGLTILYCLYGAHPFCNKRRRQNFTLKRIQKWYNKKVLGKQCYIESWLGKQLIDGKIKYDLFDFLFKCLRFDQTKRMTPKQALKHKWLR